MILVQVSPAGRVGLDRGPARHGQRLPGAPIQSDTSNYAIHFYIMTCSLYNVRDVKLYNVLSLHILVRPVVDMVNGFRAPTPFLMR